MHKKGDGMKNIKKICCSYFSDNFCVGYTKYCYGVYHTYRSKDSFHCF